VEGQHVAHHATRHEHRRDKRLAALGLARDSHQFAAREAGAPEQLEQEVHGRQLSVGCDAQLLQCQLQRAHGWRRRRGVRQRLEFGLHQFFFILHSRWLLVVGFF
jgi:hypothetical protein